MAQTGFQTAHRWPTFCYRYLKGLWADRPAERAQCRFNVRLEAEHSCGIAAMSIEEVQPRPLCEYLYQKRGISTWPIEIAGLTCLWVSPCPFTIPTERANALIEVANGELSA
jgi:hypothetical protein